MVSKQFLLEKGTEFYVTNDGENFFNTFQIDIDQLKKKRRMFCNKCLDWSERRHHLAGSLGNAMLHTFMELDWIQRVPKSPALKVTAIGESAWNDKFGIDVYSD